MGIEVARKYSRQVMQKLVQSGTPALTTALQLVASFSFDDECIVKRIRASVAHVDPAAVAAPYLFKLYIVQGDDPTTSTGAGDIDSELRLISFKFDVNAVNIDQTITMRKLAGSYVNIYADVGTGTANAKFHAALHYLEV